MDGNESGRRTLPEMVERAEIGRYRHDGHEQGKEDEFVEDGAVVCISTVAAACMHTHGCTLSSGAMAILPVDTLLDMVCGAVYDMRCRDVKWWRPWFLSSLHLSTPPPHTSRWPPSLGVSRSRTRTRSRRRASSSAASSRTRPLATSSCTNGIAR